MTIDSDLLSRKHRRILFLASVASRIGTWAVALLAARLSIFDSSPHLLVPPNPIIGPLLRWDVFHFGHVAKEGYMYEHEWAFFPGTPLVMRYAGRIIQGLRRAQAMSNEKRICWENMLLGGAGAVISTYGATDILYQLSLRQLGSQHLAFVASLLALIPTSPATLSLGPSTEPFFTYTSYAGMLYCTQERWILATACFVLSNCFRSNGILLSGFLLWGMVVQPALKHHSIDLRAILSAIILALVSVSPSIAYQYVAYRVFCREVISTRPAWCNNNLPSIYNHVQLKYWDVGFLRYWTPAQIPNFVLAAPVLTLLFVFCIHHLTTVMPALFDDASMISLGLQSERRPHMLRHPGKPFLRRSITPHAAHAVILSVILLFSAHVQIVLRFAAALPVVYWAGAWLVLDHPTWGHAWVTYSIVWGTVSVVLWAAFLPPA